MLRFVVVGTGKMAAAIMPDFIATPGIEVVAVAGRTPQRVEEFRTAWGIPRAIALDELADHPADACYIATSQSHHAQAALAAIAGGMHVLVEKAFASSATEARLVFDAAARAGVFAMEAMWMRFTPTIRAAAEIAANDIGEPRSLVAAFGRAVPSDTGHRLWDAAQGGGSMLDQAVYPIALADLLLGPASSVHAVGTTRGYSGEQRGVDTEVSILLGHPSGAQATSVTSIRAQLNSTATLGGSSGSILFDEYFWAAQGFTVRDAAGAERRVEFPRSGNGYREMLAAVRDAIAGGLTEHPSNPWAATVRVLEVIDEARRQIGG